MLDGHTLYGYLPGGASGGILPASMANLPLDFDTLTPYGCFIGSAAVVVLSDKDSAAAAARNVMKFFADESCGQCTPCRVGTAKGAAADDRATVGSAAAAGAVAGDGGRLDLRPGSGRAQSRALSAEVLSQRSRADALTVHPRNGKDLVSRAGETILQIAQEHGIEIPRLCYMEGMRAGRQLPHVHGRDQRRARACAVVLPLSDGRHGGHHQQRARPHQPEDVDRAAAVGCSRDVIHAELGARCLGEEDGSRQATLPRAAAAGRRPVASRDRRPSRRVHPVQALRPCLPRGAGQRRHRIRLPRRPFEDRLRLRRPDGRLDVRRLR